MKGAIRRLSAFLFLPPLFRRAYFNPKEEFRGSTRWFLKYSDWEMDAANRWLRGVGAPGYFAVSEQYGIGRASYWPITSRPPLADPYAILGDDGKWK